GDEGASWLGVETQEVNGDKAKEFKLPAERGALLARIAPDSPASKAGLKENDVVTEVNGQPVEGAVQFRRIIREIPAGRSVQLTVWRDGRTQGITATLGKTEDLHHQMRKITPGTFAFEMPDIPEVRELPEMPEMPEIPDIPEMPPMGWDGAGIPGGHARLGIDAEDLNGQLGAFFGVPEGEGILVRGVNAGSPAEKAGVKAGDVITFLNGERIRSTGELRQKLASHHEENGAKDKDSKGKATTVKLGVLRNKSEISLTVELPEAPARTRHVMTHRTHV
ncbi:MAG: PDZ domain-containing protein, partial [Acidobacteriota bacterium]|nr:PDZ domain-containing protein [Acidobacteriota bacterium]